MTIAHLVITDVDERGDPIHGSSVVKVLAGAGQATPLGRSVKRTPQKLRNTTHAIRKTWNYVIAEPLSTRRRPLSGRKISSRALSGITGSTGGGEEVANGIHLILPFGKLGHSRMNGGSAEAADCKIAPALIM